METRSIGSLAVTVLGIGCSQFGRTLNEEESRQVVDSALEEGINFFETSDTYGETRSEVFLGRALSRHRDDVVIATKVGREDATAAGIRAAAEASLRRLDTDHVDLLQLHYPHPETPIDETLGAFDELVREGKALEIGCSNFTLEQLREAAAVAHKNGYVRFVSASNQYSLIVRDHEQDVLRECDDQGMAFMPYYPLFRGMLTGKYRRGEPPPEGARLGQIDRWRDSSLTERNFDLVEHLTEYAENRGHTILELAFAWLLGRKSISSVFAGITSPEQVRSNASSISWDLTASERAEVDELTARHAADIA